MSQIREQGQQTRLAKMEARGLILLPKRTPPMLFLGAAFPNRGKLASEMILEDRR